MNLGFLKLELRNLRSLGNGELSSKPLALRFRSGGPSKICQGQISHSLLRVQGFGFTVNVQGPCSKVSSMSARGP